VSGTKEQRQRQEPAGEKRRHAPSAGAAELSPPLHAAATREPTDWDDRRPRCRADTTPRRRLAAPRVELCVGEI
jgi:hypothetical protein